MRVLLLLKSGLMIAYLLLLSSPSVIYAQNFPNPASLSTGQGTPGASDPIWQASDFWYTANPPNPMGLTYSPALINNNCAPGSWVDPATLPPPTNNANWITGANSNCANNTDWGYRYFRLTLDLPPDCNGFSVTVAGNYVLNFDGYVDNAIQDVFINGNSTGITGSGFTAGNPTTISLPGPWQVGINYVDVLVYNSPNGGQSNPYGLLLVASATTSDDTDNDGVPNINDLCPCDPGTNQYGCTDPSLHNCDIDAIRTAFTNAGCIEMPGCSDQCSMYFLNPQQMTGSQAQAFAQNLGANLVSVQSQAENDCILSALANLGYGAGNDVIWIGFNDDVSEGNFVWYDQSPITYTNWAAGEPNNLNGENCVQIYPGNGQWNDLNCNTNNSKSIIEVNLCPVIDPLPDFTICENQTANLLVTGTILGSQPYTYSWNNGVSGTSNPVSPSSTANFIVTVSDRYDCSTSDTSLVTVNANPNVDAGADQSVCNGDAITLTATGAQTYSWDNNVTNGQTFTPTATTTYTVTGTAANGCQATDQTVVAVNPLPNVNAGPDLVICSGDTVTLSGNGADTYSWDNGVLDDQAFVPATTTTYTVTGTDLNGCQDTDQATVTVNPLPVVNGGPDQVVCYGTSVTLAASGAQSYVWDNGVTDGVAFTATASNLFTVSGTDANGCQDTDEVMLTVNPLPMVEAGPDTTVCFGTSLTFSGSGAQTYSWDNGIMDGQAFDAQNSTLFTVTGTDVNGCQDTDELQLTVNPLPLVDFAIQNPFACVPHTVTFQNLSPTSVQCEWIMSDGTQFDSCTVFSYTFTDPQCLDVILTVTDANGCTDELQEPAAICTYALPEADFLVDPANELSVVSPEFGFTNLSSGSISWLWLMDDDPFSSDQNPFYNFPYEPGVHEVTLIAYSDMNCTDTMHQQIRIIDELIYYIPNTFTPDNDQFNQSFQPVFNSGYDPFNFSLLIFNRWGEVIFESHDASVGWDGTYNGKIVQEGTYSWQIRIKLSENDAYRTFSGHVNLFR